MKAYVAFNLETEVDTPEEHFGDSASEEQLAMEEENTVGDGHDNSNYEAMVFLC